ncbi:Calcipressin-domain-containing protein [Cercophora newfieldiana]|uniref:Calcipressin-domain-containing protein n=1 Tax=Cercophora newfieldiana TaxID=92897 RepID=A0AA40CJ25_9PEZI|nr:Calcipressin-domain-containing protein [Cercophora newfieldiana]
MEQETRPAASSERIHKIKSLSLDLSKIPPLEQPTPPSNTLLITNLQSLEIFRPDNLQQIRDLMSKTAPIHCWSPLKSFRRIVVSFYDEEAAIAVRKVWDGEAILGNHCRIYFGKETPISQEDRHLALPDAGKLFFISPPPSPPHGWEMRLEDAPNKMVHAEDLADALARLRHQAVPDSGPSPVSPVHSNASGMRSRSSTLIFQPKIDELGNSPKLPCVMVDDMTDEPDEMSPVSIAESKPGLAHTMKTMRPPVELTLDD